MRLSALIPVFQQFTHPERAARDLQEGQAAALRVAGNLEDLRAE